MGPGKGLASDMTCGEGHVGEVMGTLHPACTETAAPPGQSAAETPRKGLIPTGGGMTKAPETRHFGGALPSLAVGFLELVFISLWSPSSSPERTAL